MANRNSARSRAFRPVIPAELAEAERSLSRAAVNRFPDLAVRVRRYEHELLMEDKTRDSGKPRFYILDPGIGQLTVVIGGSEADVEAWCRDYESEDDREPLERERAAAEPAAAVRRAVKRVVKAYRDGGQDLSVDFDHALAELQKAVRTGGAA